MHKRDRSLINLENMLLIGSSGRNSGKTLFACRVLDRFATDFQITGLKVTTITERDSGCPRGGRGCGVCSSLAGDFEIFRETGQDGDKDTSRLLAAGAGAVYWLKVMRYSLQAGLKAVLELINPYSLILCESNSLRSAVIPGLFFMISNERGDTVKQSARLVQQLADRLVTFDGTDFNFNINSLYITGNNWKITEKNQHDF